MPATSRSGERLQPPLGQRPRRLALEVEDHPAAVGEHRLAEVVVAVRADDAAAGADVRQRLQPLAHVLAAAGDRRQRLVVSGRSRKIALDLLVDRRGEQRQRLRRSAPRARTPDRRRPSRARCACSPVTSPSARRRVEEAVRVASASSSSASSQPSRAPARYSCRIPSVASTSAALVLVPAGQRRDVREAVRGQEAQQLELGVDARLERAGTPSGSARRRTRSTSSTARRRPGARRPCRRAGAGAARPSGSAACPPRRSTSRRPRMRCSSSRPCAGSASAS